MSLLINSVSALPVSNAKTRRAAFSEQENIFLQAQEKKGQPPDADEQEYRYRLFRTIWRLLEQDIRKERNIFDKSYVPESLEEAAKNFAATRDMRRAAKQKALNKRDHHKKTSRNFSAQQLERIAYFKIGVRELTLSDDRCFENPLRGLAALRPLLIMQFQIIASESRLAVLWMLIAPAVLLTLISLIYFLLQTRYILNMDVPTFALLGSCTWIMVRQVIFRISNSLVSNRAILNLPSIRPFDAAFTLAVFYLLIYTVVFLLLFCAGTLTGLTTFITGSVLWTSLYVIGMWGIAIGIGMIFGGIAVYWPFFLRLAAVIERALQLFSSVFFVSEQLPEDYKGYVLWCPMAHGMQLLRASYFAGYEASDASYYYFWLSMIGILTVGALFMKNALSNIKPL